MRHHRHHQLHQQQQDQLLRQRVGEGLREARLMRPSVTKARRGRGRRPREAISSREGRCLFAWEIILSATHVVKSRTGLSSEMLMTLFFTLFPGVRHHVLSRAVSFLCSRVSFSPQQVAAVGSAPWSRGLLEVSSHGGDQLVLSLIVQSAFKSLCAL